MRINYNVTGQTGRPSSRPWSSFWRADPVYQGAPTFAYEVGAIRWQRRHGEFPSYPRRVAKSPRTGGCTREKRGFEPVHRCRTRQPLRTLGSPILQQVTDEICVS